MLSGVRLVPLDVLRREGRHVCRSVLRGPQVLQLEAELHQNGGLPAAVLPHEEQLRLHWKEVLRPHTLAGARGFARRQVLWDSVLAARLHCIYWFTSA